MVWWCELLIAGLLAAVAWPSAFDPVGVVSCVFWTVLAVGATWWGCGVVLWRVLLAVRSVQK